jgi:basic membrane protein A
MKGRSRCSGRIFHGLLVSAFVLVFLGEAAAAEKKIRVAIGTEGPVSDMGWYEGGYRGAMELKNDPGVDEVTHQERVRVADLERNLRGWARGGYNLILGHGFEWGEPALKVAAQFPNTVFAVAGFFKTGDRPNVINYLVQGHETAYLAGVLSALMSKTKRIGIIGGFPIPEQISEHNGYKLGARSVNRDVRIVSVFINDWFDTAKAKEAAIAMIDQGVDVIQVTASPMGFGAIKAAEEKGVYALGTYRDVNRVAPDTVLSSSVFDWHAPMKQIVQDMKRGTVKKAYLVGVPGGGATLAPFNNKVPPEVAQKVRAIEADIKRGTLNVPHRADKLID